MLERRGDRVSARRRDAGYEPDLERLAQLAATPGAKVLLINSPGNPTGAVWSREAVRRVVEIAREHGLYVLSDEVYEEIVFEGEHVSPATFDDDGRVVTVSAVSKTYAMTGWRIGYLAATRGARAPGGQDRRRRSSRARRRWPRSRPRPR